MRLRLSTAGKIYCVCALLQNARTCLLVYMFTCFFQFTCFFFYTTMHKRKTSIRISACFPTLPHLSSRKSKKSFKKKKQRKFEHTEDFLQRFFSEIPRS